jgi:Galactose mutarotase and related enzymes
MGRNSILRGGRVMSITKKVFGKTKEGQEVYMYTLSNSNKMSADIITLGGVVVSLNVPDKNGRTADVVLGRDNVAGYEDGECYLGALIGRHGNRIENAEFELNGVTYKLAKNDGNNHLHGGIKGFDRMLWDAEVIKDGEEEALKLSYFSRDMEEGYPGNLSVVVTYKVTNDNGLCIHYSAKTDKDTVVNLTNHSYFNLSGNNSGTILDHEIYINADEYTVINSECIPTGEIAQVKGTPLDFTDMRRVGDRISADDIIIRNGNGYDHNYVLNTNRDLSKKAAELFDPKSGRFMEVYTNKPAMQFYSGNFIDNVKGKEGAVYNKNGGLCLETQYYPNSLKHKNFPSPILKAGAVYDFTTIYKFGAK